jgi:hypothetical protein
MKESRLHRSIYSLVARAAFAFAVAAPSPGFACDPITVALGTSSVESCPRLDADGDGVLDLDELLEALKLGSGASPGLSPRAAGIVSIDLGTASGPPGSQVTFDVALDDGGEEVVATQNDITFDPLTPIASQGGVPDCTANPATGKDAFTAFHPIGCTPGVDCTRARVIVISLSNLDPVPNGVLYSCNVNIDPSTAPGTYPLLNTDVESADSMGLHTTVGSDGAIVVTAPLDHFKCYKAKDLKNPKFAVTTVTLEDQFGINDGSFDVKKPFLFCTPADKNGEGITNGIDHLACYKMKGPKLDKDDRPAVEVVNQLGTVRLEAQKPFLLCVPTTKTLLP